MAIRLTQDEIDDLIREPKPLPSGQLPNPKLLARRGHQIRDVDLRGESGSHFRIIIRQSQLNALDFSVILAYLSETSNEVFRLRRYNGKGYHTNHKEGERFHDFHIHEATE